MYIKFFYIKMLLHVSVNKPSSGSLLLHFAKVMFIKIVEIRRYEFSALVFLHNYPDLLVCTVHCADSHSALRTAHTHTHTNRTG